VCVCVCVCVCITMLLPYLNLSNSEISEISSIP